MFKKLLAGLFIFFLFIFQATNVSAIDEGDKCEPKDLKFPRHGCEKPLFCKPAVIDDPDAYPNVGSCETLIPEGDKCDLRYKDDNHGCEKPLFCKPVVIDDPDAYPNVGSCEVDTNSVSRLFGKIQAPSPLAGFLEKNPTGASAISQFLSNFVSLLFTIAIIALIFMILWAAFEWLTSGGDKEKLAAAQRRLLHAFIGILLFSVAFAIIRVLGVFTGFSFFAGT